jgi:hypothetical protein
MSVSAIDRGIESVVKYYDYTNQQCVEPQTQNEPTAIKSTADLFAIAHFVATKKEDPSLIEKGINYLQRMVNWRPIQTEPAYGCSCGCERQMGHVPTEDVYIPSVQIDAEVNWPVEPDSGTPVLTDDPELWVIEGEGRNRFIISEEVSFTTQHWQDEDFSDTPLAWVLGTDSRWIFPNITDPNLACFPDMIDTTPGAYPVEWTYCAETDEEGNPIYQNLARCPNNENNRLKLYLMSFRLLCYKKVNADTTEEIYNRPVVITTLEQLEANPDSGVGVGAICGENPRPIYILIPDACTAPGQLMVNLSEVRFAADPRNSDPNGTYATGIDPYVFYAPGQTVDASQIIDPETY